MKDDSIEVYSYKQGEISGYDVKDEVEDDLAGFEIIDPNYNGSHYEGTLEETIQSYITYEDMEPTVMYVISGNKDESYAIYNDPNVTEGALMMGGMLSANEEVTVDGKAIMNEVEYYRLAHNDGAMVNFQYIIPAEYVTTEKQVEQPIENQKPAEPQQSTEQQPTEDQPSTPPEAPAYDPSSGVSEEDWNKVFGIGCCGGISWNPGYGDEVTIEKNENGGLTISGDTGLSQEIIDKSGNQVVH